MAEAIIKYSDIIEDDGGFSKTQEDLRKLGDALIAEAKRIKKEIGIIDPKNIDLLSQYADAVEVLKQTHQTHKKTLKVVHRAQEEQEKQQKEAIKITNQQNKSLADLELEYKKLQNELKHSKKLEKEGNITTKEAAEQQSKLQVELKNVRGERTKNQKEILDSNKLSKKQEKLQKAMITLQKERAETLDEVRERMAALRTVVQDTKITTVEGKAKIADYNKEINELTDVLSENSDKFVQNKINVGNYKDSIVEALGETEIFQTGIAGLDNVLNKLSASIVDMTKNQEDNTKATKEADKATTGLKRSFKGFSKVLKASGILLVIGAIAGLFALFRQGRSGVIKTQKAMAVFSNTIKVLIAFAADAIKVVGGLFSAIGNSFENLFLKIERFGLKTKKTLLELVPGNIGVKEKLSEIDSEIAKINKQLAENPSDVGEKWEELMDIFAGLKDRINDGAESIKQDFEGIVRAFEISDEIRKTTLELIKLKSELRGLQAQSDDSTLSLRTRLETSRLALTKNLEVLEKENQILGLNVELANAKARADLLANQTTIGARAKAVALIKDEAEFAKALLQLNIDLSERQGENPLDDMLLEQSQVALQNYLTGIEEIKHAYIENGKVRREIERDIFEQNLDYMIDFIDRQKDLSEQYVNDVTKNFESRAKEFDRFLSKFGANAQKELTF